MVINVHDLQRFFFAGRVFLDIYRDSNILD